MKLPQVDYTWLERKGKYICLYGKRKGRRKTLLFKYYISEGVKRGYALGKNVQLIIGPNGDLQIKKQNEI